MAHLGVIQALEEAGIVVDMVGGTSQGAFVSALYARYPHDSRKREAVSREFSQVGMLSTAVGIGDRYI